MNLNRLRMPFLILLFLLVAPSAAADQRSGGLTATFASGKLTVSGVTPQGSVAIFAMIREAKAYHVAVQRMDRVMSDADGDGRIELEAKTALGDRAVFAAVDLATAAWVVASPDPEGLRLIDRSEFLFPNKGLGQLLHMEINRSVLDVLIVRAAKNENKAGAWKARLVDGASTDADGRVNSFSRLEFDALTSVLADGETKMKHALPGDTIILIDPRSLDVLAGRIGVEVVP